MQLQKCSYRQEVALGYHVHMALNEYPPPNNNPPL